MEVISRKPIGVSVNIDRGDGSRHVTAVCDDGTMWVAWVEKGKIIGKWLKLQCIPQPTDEYE